MKPAEREAIGPIIEDMPEFDSVSSVFFSWDLENDWKILDVSDNVSRFGYTVEECIDNDFSYSDLVHPHDLSRIISEMESHRKTGEISSFVQHYRILAKNGSVVSVNVLNNLNVNADRPVGSAYGLMLELVELSCPRYSDNANSYFKSIVASLKEAIWVLDHDLNVIYANDSFYDIFKVEPEDIVGENAGKFVQFRLKYPGLFSKLKDVCSKGEVLKGLEFTHTFSSIGTRSISLNASRISPLPEDACLLLVTFEDITELKKAEDLLRSEEKYSRLVEKGTEGIIVVQDDMVKYANTKFCELRGLPKEEIIGSGVFSHLPTEYHRMVSIKFKKWISSKKEDSKRYEVSILSKNGENIPVEITSSYSDYGGKPGIVIIVNDIREEKKVKEALADTEKNFRLLFEKSPVGIVRFDQDGIITNSNEVFDELFTYLHENMIGHSLFDLLQDDKIREGFNDILKGKSNNFEAEIQHINKNGSQVLRLNLSSLIVDGFPQGGMAIFDDITLHKMGEESLKQNEERLRTLLELSQMAENDVPSIMRFALHSAVELTQSNEGYLIMFAEDELPDMCLCLFRDGNDQYTFSENINDCSLDLETIIKECVVAGKPVFSDISIQRDHIPDVSKKTLRSISIPLYDDGSIKFMLGVGNKYAAYNYLDTHDLKILLQSMWKLIIHREANEALRASEEKYSALVEKGNDGIVIIQDGTLRFANSVFCEIVGMSAEKIQGTKFSTYLDHEYKRMMEKLFSKTLEKKKNAIIKTEVILLDKSEREIPVEITTSLIEHNEKTSIMAIIHDITEQKEKEQELLKFLEVQKVLQAVIKTSPAIVFFWGAEDGWPVEFVSENITNFGYSPEDFLFGMMNFNDIIHPSDSERVHEYFVRKNHEGASEYRIEYRIITKSEAVRWVEERSTPQYDEEGNRTHIQGIILDITDRKRINQFMDIQSEVGNFFTPSGDLQETFDQLLEFSLHIEGLDCGALYILQKNIGDLNLVSHIGLSEDFVTSNSHYGPDTMQSRIFLMGYPLYKLYSDIFPHTRNDKRVDEGLRATAVVPVKYAEDIVAVLFLASHVENDIPYEIRTSLEAIAAQMGSVIGRIKTEIELQKNQNDLELLLNSIEDLIFVLDKEGCVLYTNEVVTKKLGYSTGEITGMNFIKMYPHDKVLNVANYFGDAVSGKETVFTLPLLTSRGMAISFETMLTKGSWNKQEAFVAVCREINTRGCLRS